ncbi:hypothetical protein OIO90_003001 [Microbotryomycetes sp. JL221]|nr:hypothetical protein OIO90_003001 [Microbotryomycetes sp. JL221]
MASAAVDDVDYYALLEVEPEASLDQIRTAYRKKSLKVHPDRNPNNPEAAAKFHELNQASQVLLDPMQRASFDKLRSARLAHKQRFAALDSKRQAMQQELERSEKEYKKRKLDERDQVNELQRLKEQGRKLRETRLKQQQTNSVDGSRLADVARNDKLDQLKDEARRDKSNDARSPTSATNVVELGPLDTTLKFKWTKTSSIPDKSTLETRIRQLTQPGTVDIDVILGADKISKGRASVKFATLSSAIKVLEAVKKTSRESWKGLEVFWAAGHPPSALTNGQHSTTQRSPSPVARASIPAEMLVNNPDEDSILAQLRAKERQKLMDELERQDAAEEATS